jgi:hypothetical protein
VGRLRAEPAVISMQVDNSASWIGDHVSYLSNPGQVLPLIYGVLSQLSGPNDPYLVKQVNWIWQHRQRRASVRGRGLALAPVVAAAVALPTGLLLAQIDDDLAGFLSIAMLISSVVIWGRFWKRWERRCCQLEPHGLTVPATWRQLMRPSFWLKLPAASPPHKWRKESDNDRETLFRRAMSGSPSFKAMVAADDPEQLPPLLAARPVVVIFVSLAMLAGLAAASSPVLLGAVKSLSANELVTSPTAVIARALLEPWVIALAAATIVIPGVVLDALGELPASGRQPSLTRRRSVAALGAGLGAAALGIAASVIVLQTVRPIGTLSIGDCFDTHPADQTRPPDDQAHFDVVRIPCEEPHEAELLGLYSVGETALSSLDEPNRLAMTTCGASLREPELSSGLAIERRQAISIDAFVPRGSGEARQETAGIYCFAAARRCAIALVGRLGRDLRIQARSEAPEGCFPSGASASGENLAPIDRDALESSWLRIDVGRLAPQR